MADVKATRWKRRRPHVSNCIAIPLLLFRFDLTLPRRMLMLII